MDKKFISLSQRNNIGIIQKCSCGLVHVHLNNFFIRFYEEDFFSFASMVGEAIFKLKNEDTIFLNSNREKNEDKVIN